MGVYFIARRMTVSGVVPGLLACVLNVPAKLVIIDNLLVTRFVLKLFLYFKYFLTTDF